MTKGKLWVMSAATLGIGLVAPAAFARDTVVIITPGIALQENVQFQPAAPTRTFTVEKAFTLAPGERRFGANLRLGGLGTGRTIGVAGGMDVRADMNVQPGLEAGFSATGLGGTGIGNALGNLDLRGKVALGRLMVGTMPVMMAGLADVGAMAAGGGIASGSVGVGLPLTASITPNINMTISPGLAVGFGLNNLGTSRVGIMPGIAPALGLGLDIGLARNLSAIIDGNLNFGGGFGAKGGVGVRYGLTDNIAADVFFGYNGNPLTNVNAGTLGLGGTYAF